MRSGDEPIHARSPLRLRLVLAIFGLLVAIAGVVVFVLVGDTAVAVGCGVLFVVAAVDIGVVIMRIRQGPHFQPGPDVPPYRPIEPEPRPVREWHPLPQAKRRHRYELMIGTSLVLLLCSWTWVRLLSPAAAIVMSLIALVLVPLAVIIANAGSPINRR